MKRNPTNAKDRSQENIGRYSWSLVTYNSPEQFEPLLSVAKHWAWIYHDRDEKEPHYHIYVSFATKKSPKQLLSLIEGEQNTMYEAVKGTPYDLLTYYTHAKEPDKAQYTHEEIHLDDEKYWARGEAQEDKEDANRQFIEDLLSNKSMREMAIKYGRDYMKNWTAYQSFVYAMSHQEMRELQKGLDGIPSEATEEGEPKTIHCELSLDEYERVMYLRGE